MVGDDGGVDVPINAEEVADVVFDEVDSGNLVVGDVDVSISEEKGADVVLDEVVVGDVDVSIKKMRKLVI